MKIVALILARGGSKGVPRKNIKLLNGKPLLSYVLNEAIKCEVFDKIVVSSDDNEILRWVEDFSTIRDKRVHAIQRPPEFATDTATSIDAVKHILTIIDADYIVLLNACTPLTKAEDINGVVKIAWKTRPDSVVSLVEDFSCHPSKICRLGENGEVINEHGFETAEREKLDKCYKRNTAIYMASKETIMSGTFFGQDTRGYVMPQSRSLDINTMDDWKMAEY